MIEKQLWTITKEFSNVKLRIINLNSISRNVLSRLTETPNEFLEISVHILKHQVQHCLPFFILTLFHIHQPFFFHHKNLKTQSFSIFNKIEGSKNLKKPRNLTRKKRKSRNQESKQNYIYIKKKKKNPRIGKWKLEPDDMGIAREHAKNGDLAKSGGRDAFFVLVEASFLEGYDSASGSLSRSVHLPVRPFSYFL